MIHITSAGGTIGRLHWVNSARITQHPFESPVVPRFIWGYCWWAN